MVQQTLHEKVDISLKPNKMLTRNLTFLRTFLPWYHNSMSIFSQLGTSG